MTAGTKAILLLSVFGLVVLVACYGDGPSLHHRIRSRIRSRFDRRIRF